MEKISKLSAQLPDHRPALECIDVGTLWSANYGEYGLWYRSLVLAVNKETKQGLIYFIDYGGFGVVDIGTQLRWLSDDLMKFPPQLLPCKWIHVRTDVPMYSALLVYWLMKNTTLTLTVVEAKESHSNANDVCGEHGLILVNFKEVDGIESILNSAAVDVPEGKL